MSNKWSVKRVLVMVIFTLGCCLLVAGYAIGREIDRNSCYERLGEKLNVAPTYPAVSNAIDIQVKEKVHQGMTENDVTVALHNISPFNIVNTQYGSDGAKLEYMVLTVCSFPENGVEFLAVYDKNGTLESIRQYVDD